jgi:hypothetical protein
MPRVAAAVNADGAASLCQMLLEHGADKDLDKKNKADMTPIEYTQRNSREREFLLQKVSPDLRKSLEETDKKE